MSSVLAWLSGAVSWVPEWLTIFIIVAGSMITFACCMCWKCDRDEAAYWRERASGNQAEEQEEGAGDAALAAEEQEEGTGTTAGLMGIPIESTTRTPQRIKTHAPAGSSDVKRQDAATCPISHLSPAVAIVAQSIVFQAVSGAEQEVFQ